MTGGLEVLALATFAVGLAGGFALRRHRNGSTSASQEHAQPETAHPSDDRFDALVRALPLGVVMLDRRLRVRFANRAAAAIFGFERSRVRGSHLIAAIPSIELERRAQGVLAGERTAAPLIVSGKSVNRSYSVSVYPLPAQSDGDAEEPRRETDGVLIIAEDQTELLTLERARQEFLTNVSHELRTPLSSIKLMLETVAEAGDGESLRMFLPQALGQVDRLATLVERLLEQARAESGQMVLQIAEIDLQEVARPIVASFQPQAASSGINLELRVLRPVIIEADEHRLAQIFVNLIDNALRYTARGSITVALDVEDGYAAIRVSDTGIGIPYRDLPYVFERFYVVDRSRTRESQRAGGAGLGLSIVKQIAQAHGGSVDVQSALGSGTTISVRIPVVAVP